MGKKTRRGDQSSEKRKVHKKDEHPINKVPDEILAMIRSKLSLREIATTSLVSKRWSKQWEETIAVAPRLEFHGSSELRWKKEEDRMAEYVKWVNQVMKLHSAPTLEVFTIYFGLNSVYADDINKWVEFGAKKSVKKLRLDLCPDEYYSYSSHGSPYDASNILANWPMKCLRYMVMRNVNVGANVIEGLLSNSPLLEHLCVIDSQGFHKLEIADHQAPNLNYLDIFNCDDMLRLKISVTTLKHLVICDNMQLKHVNICASNLRWFTYYGHLKVSDGLMDMHVHVPRLSQLCLGLKRIYNFEYLEELLGLISQVNMLRLYVPPQLDFGYVDEANDIPEFSNLDHLEFSIFELGSDRLSHLLHWPIKLIKAAPFLHSLSFKMFYTQGQFILDDVDFKGMYQNKNKKVKPVIAHKNLKVVEFVGFSGCSREVELLLHVVDICVSLERIIIDVRLPQANWFWKENLSLPEIDDYDENGAEMRRNGAQKLKTLIRSDIDVVLI